MNFKNWYNKTLSQEHTPEKLRAAGHGWNACKMEVLKIVDEYNLKTAHDIKEILKEIQEKL